MRKGRHQTSSAMDTKARSLTVSETTAMAYIVMIVPTAAGMVSKFVWKVLKLDEYQQLGTTKEDQNQLTPCSSTRESGTEQEGSREYRTGARWMNVVRTSKDGEETVTLT